MHRFLSAFATAAFALSLGTAVSADSMATAKPAMASAKPMMSKSMMAKPMTCPKGQTLVKGYKSKSGKMVAPYCRKSK
jgi:hypothetical protein